ncbi:MAG TPA: hypothetical protein EYN06_01265, partial [Myxococcales bacterium]|nr:hypothetical protein [Myxococcales bacterium]
MSKLLPALMLVLAVACHRTPAPKPVSEPPPTVVPKTIEQSPAPQPKAPEPKVEQMQPDVVTATQPQVNPKSADEAENKPPLSLLLANRVQWLDKVVTLRVHAGSGDYFNCNYKGREASYRHLRLRGDGSAYLDAYLPRDPAGERLWVRLKKKKSIKLSVKVITRSETFSNICVGQVEILDHREGWDFDTVPRGYSGILTRRIANARDTQRAKNRPEVVHFTQNRKRFIDKEVSFRVRARLGRYFQCKYRDAERTHFALFLQGDGFKGLRAYHLRNEKGTELAQLLALDEGVRLTVKVTVPKGRFDEYCNDQVEIVS